VLKEKNLALEAEVEKLKVISEENRMEINNLRNWLRDLHMAILVLCVINKLFLQDYSFFSCRRLLMFQ